jgi:hypothetical protein
MELIVSIAVKHTIDFEDVGICIGARELVTSPIEAEDKPLADVAWSMVEGLVRLLVPKMQDCWGRRALSL